MLQVVMRDVYVRWSFVADHHRRIGDRTNLARQPLALDILWEILTSVVIRAQRKLTK